MRAKGINYDTGFFNKGPSSREPFDAAVVRRELQIIRDDLHCNAVRVTGGDPDRLESAARAAAELGLEVWFAPFTCDLTFEHMLDLLDDCAERAERLRETGAEVVLVAGAEISLLNHGFLPGDTIAERLELLSDFPRLREAMPLVPARVNDFFSRALPRIRERFGGQVTYAAMPFEGVDWTLFDIVSLDLYRSAEVAGQFAAGIRSLVAQGKPAAITEFGCTTYQGSADRGARGGEVIVWDNDTGQPLRLNGEYVRDEAEQAQYIRELLEIFEQAGVDSTFLFTFAQYSLPHRTDGREDMDKGAYAIVKVYEDRFGATYPDMCWEPKLAFHAVADFYSKE
jgi:hypothetical protein